MAERLRAISAGLAYAGVVFALGFILGVVRVMWLVGVTGELVATLLELPVILGASWVICRRLVTLWRLPASPGPRLAMGTAAFALLMLLKLALSATIGGRTPAEHLAMYGEHAKQLGLAGQVAFAVFPLVQLRGNRTQN